MDEKTKRKFGLSRVGAVFAPSKYPIKTNPPGICRVGVEGAKPPYIKLIL